MAKGSGRARSVYPPTAGELAIERNRQAFALSAKYPVRPDAVLNPEQLAATRAQLDARGGVSMDRAKLRNREDRRPLTLAEIDAVRAAHADQSSWAAVDDWLSSLPAEGLVH